MSDLVSFQQSLSTDQSNIIQCITAYFTEVFYNVLYMESKNLKSKDVSFKSLTDAYKAVLRNFVSGISEQNYISVTIQGIGKKFSEFLLQSAYIDVKETTTKILQIFIIPDILKDIQNNDKVRLETVIDILQNIGRNVTNVVIGNIQFIIDTRTQEASDIIQQVISDTIARLACEYNIKLSRRIENKTFSHSNTAINEQLVAKCKSLLAEKLELGTRLAKYEQLIRIKVEENAKLQEEIRKLKKSDYIPEEDELKYGGTVALAPVYRESAPAPPSVYRESAPAPAPAPAPVYQSPYQIDDHEEKKPSRSKPQKPQKPDEDTFTSEVIVDPFKAPKSDSFSFIEAAQETDTVVGIQYGDLSSEKQLPINTTVEDTSLFA